MGAFSFMSLNVASGMSGGLELSFRLLRTDLQRVGCRTFTMLAIPARFTSRQGASPPIGVGVRLGLSGGGQRER